MIRIAFVGGNEFAKTVLFKILTGEMEPDEGTYKWGVTTSQSYFPKDNTEIFDTDLAIVDWLTQFSEIKDAMKTRQDKQIPLSSSFCSNRRFHRPTSFP